jgi:endonuclease/exonuclease/phosphatase family metal-dependent hydrolase
MIKKILFFSIIALFIGSCTLQEKKHNVVFYNVENLFDTINHPEKRDDDFTPKGRYKYSSERYQKKLEKLSKVLATIDSTKLPSVIGLCEVENRLVLEDLIKQKALLKGNYGIAHTESPDKRGIDCAFLYNKNDFQYISHNVISIQFPWEPNYKTRDILHVTGKMEKEELHFFINHWPSRRGGQEKSEKNRVFVAEQLKKAVDKIQSEDENAKIIIMGDFNDEPNNKAVIETLEAGNNKNLKNPSDLYNLMYDLDLAGKGTYNYRGNWNMLDNLIVSNSLLKDTKGLHTSFDAGKIYQAEWICYKNRKGIFVPSRTYGGPNYYGGFSDHFPVYFQLKK